MSKNISKLKGMSNEDVLLTNGQMVHMVSLKFPCVYISYYLLTLRKNGISPPSQVYRPVTSFTVLRAHIFCIIASKKEVIMPWKKEETNMELKAEFVQMADQPDANMSHLCRRFGISRPTRLQMARPLLRRWAGRAVRTLASARPLSEQNR